MARYYDIDKLADMIQAKADTIIAGKEAFLYVAKWLEVLPPADVVPKREVERLVQDVTRLEQEKDALIKNYSECMKDYAGDFCGD